MNSWTVHLLLSRYVVVQDLVIFMASIMTMQWVDYCEMVQLYTFHCETIKANEFYIGFTNHMEPNNVLAVTVLQTIDSSWDCMMWTFVCPHLFFIHFFCNSSTIYPQTVCLSSSQFVEAEVIQMRCGGLQTRCRGITLYQQMRCRDLMTTTPGKEPFWKVPYLFI